MLESHFKYSHYLCILFRKNVPIFKEKNVFSSQQLHCYSLIHEKKLRENYVKSRSKQIGKKKKPDLLTYSCNQSPYSLCIQDPEILSEKSSTNGFVNHCILSQFK